MILRHGRHQIGPMDWHRSHGHLPHSSMHELRRSCLLSHWRKLGVIDGGRATFDLLALVWRYFVCHVLLLLSISPVAIRVDPTVVHLLQPDRETSTDHAEPVMIIHQHLRLATGAFACRRAQTDPRPQVPLTDPIRDPVSRERGALRVHPAQRLCRSVLVIIYEWVGFAIPIDIADEVPIA